MRCQQDEAARTTEARAENRLQNIPANRSEKNAGSSGWWRTSEKEPEMLMHAEQIHPSIFIRQAGDVQRVELAAVINAFDPHTLTVTIALSDRPFTMYCRGLTRSHTQTHH